MPQTLKSLFVEMIVPLATWWVGRQERRILKEGMELSPEEKRWAANVGVKNVDKIRLLYISVIPMPGSVLTYRFFDIIRKPLHVGGMAAHYGIYVVKSSRNDPSLLVHELAHIAQYERLGGIRPFLKKYFEECFRYGYDDASMEIEAKKAAEPYNRPPGW